MVELHHKFNKLEIQKKEALDEIHKLKEELKVIFVIFRFTFMKIFV